MCGNRPCKSCEAADRRRRRVGGIKKSKMANKIGNLAMSGAGVAGGIVIGKMITNNIPQLSSSPLFSGGAQLAIAYMLSGRGRGKTAGILGNVSQGMAANAMVDLITGVAGPGVSASLGLNGLGAFKYQDALGSTVMPGVAGSPAGVGTRKNLVGKIAY